MGNDMRVELKVRVFSQGERYSCWLAGYKMLISFKHKGRNVSDSEIEQAFKKAKLNFRDAKRKGLKDSDFPKACKALGLAMYGTPFGYGKAKKGAARVLAKYLKNYGPLWVAGTWPGFKHINVVSGADTKSKMLCCIDPWNNGVSAAEPLWVNFDEYVSVVKTKLKGGIQHW
jgi:papain like cysteine protease AvrRpt2